MTEDRPRPRWSDQLQDEDLAFIKRFVLASGSLKAVAGAYGISYPTVRRRLDRLIAKIALIDSQETLDELEHLARMLHVDGKLDAASLRALLAAHRKEMERNHEE